MVGGDSIGRTPGREEYVTERRAPLLSVKRRSSVRVSAKRKEPVRRSRVRYTEEEALANIANAIREYLEVVVENASGMEFREIEVPV